MLGLLAACGHGPLDLFEHRGGGSADAGELPTATDRGVDPACAPAPPDFSRPRFERLLAELAHERDPVARAARIDAFLASVAAGDGVPVRDAGTVVFVYRGPSRGPVRVAGSFNGWTPEADPLARIPGTDLWVLEKRLGRARHEYQLVVEGRWGRDPLDPHVTWDGAGGPGPGSFNSVIPALEPSATEGRLELRPLESPQLGATRDVFIYLPPGYDRERCTRYPLLVVNDGNESITRSHFDQAASATIAAGGASPLLMAFVAADPVERPSEYSCDPASKGPRYAAFLCDTLVPWLDAHYRSTARADDRGVIGASMGGLSAYAAVFWRNDCLRRAGAQSGSFWFADEEMVARVRTTDPPIRLVHAYLDNGAPDDNQTFVHDMRDALRARGYPVFYWENPAEEHTWDAWGDRFNEALGSLYPP